MMFFESDINLINEHDEELDIKEIKKLLDNLSKFEVSPNLHQKPKNKPYALVNQIRKGLLAIWIKRYKGQHEVQKRKVLNKLSIKDGRVLRYAIDGIEDRT